MKEILMEVYRTTKKMSGLDPSKPGNIKAILTDNTAYNAYVNGLAESLEDPKDKDGFIQLAENTRYNLLENSMHQINPYEGFTLPILRVFYPKLVAKEAVTVSPMNKPETVKAFMTASFAPANSSTYVSAPVTSQDISGGPSIGTPVTATVALPQTAFDVLNVASLTSTQAHLERDFEITGVSADGTNYTAVSIVPAVEGHFSDSVTITGSGSDVISGKVNYLDGTLTVSGAAAVVTHVKYQVTCTLEENRVNPKLKIEFDKVRLYAKDRAITSEFTIPYEQDARALFDISLQAELVNVMGQQIALDIDREIINALITGNQRLNASNHIGTFNRTPPGTFAYGAKAWHENIIPVMNQLSARIYTDTNMNAGNIVLANPMDVSILEDIQTFNYTGTSTLDGEFGYRSATVQGGKWKVLTSAVVPEGTMVIVYKPVDDLKMVYCYSPYIPVIVSPYPLSYKPSVTIMSRYASAMVRSNGIATLTVGA
jgi:hypothetical protein